MNKPELEAILESRFRALFASSKYKSSDPESQVEMFDQVLNKFDAEYSQSSYEIQDSSIQEEITITIEV